MSLHPPALSSLQCLLRFDRQSEEYHIDWDQVLDVPKIDVLLPSIHVGVRHLDVDVPSEVKFTLERAFLKNKVRNALLKNALKTILSKWNKKGIRAMLLKGAVSLCIPLYPNGVRCIGDLDILLQESDLSGALETLDELGYKPLGNANNYHAPVFAKPIGIEDIEIHWLPINKELTKYIPTQALWNNAQETALDGERVFIPSPEDLIWHKVIHDFFKHGNLWMSYPYLLRNLYDLAGIFQHYRKEIDWEILIKRARTAKIEKGFNVLLFLLNRDLGFPFPPKITQRIDSSPNVQQLCQWIYHTACLPEILTYAFHRFLLILIRDDGWVGRFKIFILDAVFRKPIDFFHELYGIRGKKWIPALRLFHLLRVCILQIIVLGYYGRFLSRKN